MAAKPKTKLAKAGRALRMICLAVWLAAILGGISSYLLNPEAFEPENISAFLRNFQSEIWLVYFAMSALRGFTLLPSTPLVLAGTLLFPGLPFAVLAVSMIGILISSSLIYFFSEYLGFNDFFENHKPELTHKIKARLDHPLGSLFVAGWAFFPFVPTDLVCYLAGTTKMNFWKFIAAVFAGELILCVCYIFFGGTLLRFVR